MVWDANKSTFNNLPAVPSDEKLTSTEWNNHVTDQKDHSDRHESGGIDELSVQGLSGVLADPQPPIEEDVDDFVANLLKAGDKLSWSYDDGSDTLTIDTTALDSAEVRDKINSQVAAGSGINAATSNNGDTLTLSVDELAITETFVVTDDSARLNLSVQEGDVAVQTSTEESYIFKGGNPSNNADWAELVTDPGAHVSTHESGGTDELNVSGLSGVLSDAQDPQTEAVQDIVGALLTGGANITTTYDDPNGVLTVDTTALDEEEVEDAVAGLITAGNAITVNYDDPNDTLSIAVDESSLSFYDGTNITADVDNQSVTTGSVSTEQVAFDKSRGSVSELVDTVFNGDSAKSIDRRVFHGTISSSSFTDIADVDRAGVVIVEGEEVGDQGTRFLDVVTGVFDTHTVQFSETRSSPDPRNYSSSSTLSLKMGGTTDYECAVWSLTLRADA